MANRAVSLEIRPWEAMVAGHLSALSRVTMSASGTIRAGLRLISPGAAERRVFWQLCTLEQNPVIVTGEHTFLITGPTGSTLQGTILYSAGSPRLRTGKRLRGSEVGVYKNNNFIHFLSDDGCYLVVLTIAEKGRRHPEVSATGAWGPDPRGLVKVGRLQVLFDGDSVKIG